MQTKSENGSRDSSQELFDAWCKVKQSRIESRAATQNLLNSMEMLQRDFPDLLQKIEQEMAQQKNSAHSIK